ncbi:NADPH:quinone oxidoreductase family protein [Zavarzinia sp. CC-PAN008]|uniref:NADPH:quinone oxidoreductase family protein n=1 Tax=Zavarzinia sp. CC-PAN008 TaxID=3243332 RepID=UPI003F744E4B
MKAVLCHKPGPIEDLSLGTDVAVPEPKAGQVRIAVHAAAIGYVDALIAQGLYQTKLPLPFVPGSELAGTVEALGEGVSGLAIGDRVMGGGFSGGLAEQTVVPVAGVRRIPAAMSFEAASGFRTNYLTALYALDMRGKVKAGETVLVLGAAGGTGIAAVQVAKALGARVIAAASTEEKRAYALAGGADAAVDYTTPDWREALKALAPAGVDVTFDPVGGATAEQAFRSIAWDGRHLVIGYTSGIPRLPLNLPLLKNAQVVGVDVAQIARHGADTADRLIDRLFALVEAGRLSPPVGKVYALDDFQQAYRDLIGRKAQGKVIVRVA